MFFPAAIRSALALAALAAVGIPTFLPALHALPGMSHGDCGCGERFSAGDPVYDSASSIASQSDTRGGSGHGTCVSPVGARSDVARELKLLAEAESECFLCALFASFVLSQPEQGYVPPAIDVVAAQVERVPTCVEVVLLSAACRGPPAVV